MLNIKRQLPEKVLGCTCTRLVADHRLDRKTVGILSICCACADPEGGGGGQEVLGRDPPEKLAILVSIP